MNNLRVAAGIIAAPILLAKMIAGLILMLALALPIYAYHHAIQPNAGNRDDERADEARGSCDIMQPC